MTYSLHDNVNGVKPAARLTLIAAPMVLGALCSCNVRHQSDHIPCLDTGCLICLFHSFPTGMLLCMPEKRFLTNGNRANPSYLGETPFDNSCL